jgi:hypothetical protein
MTDESIAHATQLASARLNQVLVEKLLADLSSSGTEVLARIRKDRPLEYLRLVKVVLALEEANASSAARSKRRSKLLSRLFARFR